MIKRAKAQRLDILLLNKNLNKKYKNMNLENIILVYKNMMIIKKKKEVILLNIDRIFSIAILNIK